MKKDCTAAYGRAHKEEEEEEDREEGRQQPAWDVNGKPSGWWWEMLGRRKGNGRSNLAFVWFFPVKMSTVSTKISLKKPKP